MIWLDDIFNIIISENMYMELGYYLIYHFHLL